MGKKTIYRTVFKIVIISEHELPVEEVQSNLTDALDFDDIGFNINGVTMEADNNELVGKNAVIELEKHGVTLSDFGMDAQGFEIEEDE